MIFLSFSLKCDLNLSYQAIGVKPSEELIDEIECMDNELSSLLANFVSTMQPETLDMKENEKKKSESMGCDGIEVAASSFSEYCMLRA